MRILSVGEYIKNERIKQGLTQSELCEGLCSQVTLSRIESGRQTPNIRTLNSLLERLDVPGEKFYAVLSEEEERIEILLDRISNACIDYDRLLTPASFETVQTYLKELETLADPRDRLLKQIILRYRGIIGTEKGKYSCEKKLEIYMEAIRLTVPRFSIETIADHRYAFEEIQLVRLIAKTYSEMGDHRTAMDIFRRCYDYVKKYDQNNISISIVPPVALGYAIELGMCGFYRESIAYAEEGRQICNKYRKFEFLPEIIHTEAETYHRMGDEENGIRQTRLAYAIYCAIDDVYNKADLVQDAKDYYNIDLEI